MLRARTSAAVIVVAAGTLVACAGANPSAFGATPPQPVAHRAAAVPLPDSMAALGDSITQAYDATPTKHLLTDQPQWSWSTGYAGAKVVDSQYERLLTAGDRSLKSKGHSANFSVVGAKMNALYGQAVKAVAMKASYVTILMGANDLCTSTVAGMTSVATFKTEFTSALSELQKIHGVHIFVDSIPNLYFLWQLFHKNPSAEQIWSLGICQSMLSKNGTNAQRQAVVAREKADNGVLSSVCATFSNCRFDKDAVFNYHFSAKQISSFDFFHPSISGQGKLAALSWANSFWPKDR